MENNGLLLRVRFGFPVETGCRPGWCITVPIPPPFFFPGLPSIPAPESDQAPSCSSPRKHAAAQQNLAPFRPSSLVCLCDLATRTHGHCRFLRRGLFGTITKSASSIHSGFKNRSEKSPCHQLFEASVRPRPISSTGICKRPVPPLLPAVFCFIARESLADSASDCCG